MRYREIVNEDLSRRSFLKGVGAAITLAAPQAARANEHNLFVIRESAFGGGGASFPLYVDDVFVHNLKNGSEFSMYVAPGPHNLAVMESQIRDIEPSEFKPSVEADFVTTDDSIHRYRVGVGASNLFSGAQPTLTRDRVKK